MLRHKLRGRGSSDATSCFQRSCLANDLLSDLPKRPPGLGVRCSARQFIVPAVEKPVADSWSLETCQSGATTSTSPSSSCNLARPRFLPSRSLAVKIYLGISDSGKPIPRSSYRFFTAAMALPLPTVTSGSQDRAAHSDTSRESNGHRGTHSAIQYARVAKGWLFMLHASEIRGSHSVKTLP